ncbi:hypothetical protein [Marinimicrobium agarilyticum]|uniref:hypothetical protein n=1 Tax=Marinimicrobium agarilyticum TaxID=306546 RepID=UPI00047FDE91|nr:hypothetical protein [Marinimicrobium agarilyticum]
MKYFLTFLLFFFMASTAGAETLSESEIISFIETVDSSFKNRDPEALASSLSDSAKLKGTTTVSGSQSEYSANKEQYVSSVVAAWNNYKNYEYTKEQSTITNISKSSAVVDEVVVETFEIGGDSYEVRSENKVFIEKDQKTLKAIKIITNSTVTKT